MARAITLTAPRASSGEHRSTADRILDGARELLNRPGGSDVTTNHIAAHLGISPGNLYYHFRNREQIVRAIFAALSAEGLHATAPPDGPVSARDFGERHLEGQHILWRYRFFFRDLNALVARDPALAADYRAHLGRLRAGYQGLFENLIAYGHMRRPEPADDLERVVTDSIVMWMNYLAHVTSHRPRPTITRGDVAEGALHSFLVVAPYLEERFATATRAVIEGHGRGADRNASRAS
jgi:AcrR family transcriptional regulator